jgi:hypothetical protein
MANSYASSFLPSLANLFGLSSFELNEERDASWSVFLFAVDGLNEGTNGSGRNSHPSSQRLLSRLLLLHPDEIDITNACTGA